ncbi:hypothetical protein JW906_09525 [bacterium]|nr:hypothetical protein [bacterium]
MRQETDTGHCYRTPPRTAFLTACLAVFLTIRCGDPLSESDKATLVRTLVDGPVQAGEYSLFWDGRDDRDSLLSAGIYACQFTTRDFGDRIDMAALDGGSGSKKDLNDSTVIAALPVPNTFARIENRPNPFRIRNGTNIVFSIPYPTTLLLTIHRKD